MKAKKHLENKSLTSYWSQCHSGDSRVLLRLQKFATTCFNHRDPSGTIKLVINRPQQLVANHWRSSDFLFSEDFFHRLLAEPTENRLL